MPKRARDEVDVDTDSLREISVLFIPFDAAGKFYKANSQKGVLGAQSILGSSQPKGRRRPRVKKFKLATPTKRYMSGEEISKQLPAIVRHECELVRNLYSPDWEYEENFDKIIRSNKFEGRKLSDRYRARIEHKLRGYENYPTLIFLSENPMKMDFPEKIDVRVPGKAYIKVGAIEDVVKVNRMAVYLREDAGRQIIDSGQDRHPMFFRAERVVRKTKALYKGGKDEYILKVTLGWSAGVSLCLAGVHLRATLTGSSKKGRTQERAALEKFCAGEGIQLMIGDFNMDLQESAWGSRGVFSNGERQFEPRFLIGNSSHVAYPEYMQQFSNSTGTKHYMGYLQIDRETLRLDAPSVFGRLGFSGSRSLGGNYYSDHPSIYVRVRSTRLSEAARNNIARRKIYRVLRKKPTS